MFRIILRDILIAAFLFAASGCLISTSRSVSETGTPVSSSSLRQIEPGRTSEAWLVATLGEPTARTAVEGPGDCQILTYSHRQVKSSSGSLLLLFSGSSQDVKTSRTCFEIRDGVVTRYWREG